MIPSDLIHIHINFNYELTDLEKFFPKSYELYKFYADTLVVLVLLELYNIFNLDANNSRIHKICVKHRSCTSSSIFVCKLEVQIASAGFTHLRTDRHRSFVGQPLVVVHTYMNRNQRQCVCCINGTCSPEYKSHLPVQCK